MYTYNIPRKIEHLIEHNFRISQKPVFVKKCRSMEAVEGDDVKILCEVIGDPKPDVVFRRDFLNVSTEIKMPRRKV